MKDAINSQNLAFQFPHQATKTLKNINLAVKPGECVLLCGKSGSGKTSFTRIVNGVSPDYMEGDLSGSTFTFDLQAGLAPIEEYVPLVGSVFQNPKTQHFTVNTSTELAFPAENMGWAPKQIEKRIQEVAAAFEATQLLDQDFFSLSGGQKQQVAFLQANILKPKLLVLDEVTANLDQEATEKVYQLIQHVKQMGVTVFLTEHRLAWTKHLVDRYIYMDQGELLAEWTHDEFFNLPHQRLHRYGLRATDLTKHKEKINQLSGQGPSQADLKTNNLAIGYQGQPTLENLNLAFQKKEITGIVGPNGIGKTTLANTLTGLLKAQNGDLVWKGEKVSSHQMINKSFLVMQDTNYQLFSDSVWSEVKIDCKSPQRIQAVLKALNLWELRDRHPMSLSGGQKQRLAIASAILSDKELIIFDEPTSGLDYDNMQRVGQLLHQVRDLTDSVLVVITHDIELTAGWCDRVIDLNTNQ